MRRIPRRILRKEKTAGSGRREEVEAQMRGMTAAETSLFGDRIYSSTELNRRSGEVFRTAMEGPVTISRNSDAFALMTRAEAGRLFRQAAGLAAAADLLAAIVAAKRRPEALGEGLKWLAEYGAEELDRFQQEYASALQLATDDPAGWELAAGVVEEWRGKAGAERLAGPDGEAREGGLPTI
ncbi:MAG: hypothetical protein C0504_11300 [Candidatus Solibacter sp.]|nr:hypothetical protein [Candidatus Solibacter sp.]